METGSGSFSDSGNSNASPESLNGLKFGRKIYFENAGAGAPPKAASRSGPPARKVHGGGQQQPPRCQVEGCRVDLSDAKAYYSRHKVCPMHSKCSTVIVAGLQQRFCQQCSRFHQLPEFDQEKRSCRRRLAGHNERRRKPPQGMLSSRYSRISSTIFDNSSRTGGFLVDFSAYSRYNGRDAWQALRSSADNQRSLANPSPWLSSAQNPPSNLYHLQGSEIPSGECFTGVSVADSSCALSLLSNQPWGSRNQPSGFGVRDLANAQGLPMVQSTAHVAADGSQYPNHNWGFKSSNEGSSSLHEMSPNLGLGQIAQPLNDSFSSEVELSQQNARQYMALDHSRAYDSSSTLNVHWSQ